MNSSKKPRRFSNFKKPHARGSRPARSQHPQHSPNMPTFAQKNAQKAPQKAPVKTPGPSPIPKRGPDEFPMRINKYLAMKGLATRRGADDLIARKRILINGRFAVLGDKVNEGDAVEVRGHGQIIESYVYYAYHKPQGITTEGNRKGAPDIIGSIPLRGVFPVVSLEANSQGLVLLTNDRRLVDRLQNPAHPHMKEYIVRAAAPLRPNFQEKMEAGVTFENGDKVQFQMEVIRANLFKLTTADNGSHIRHACSLFHTEVDSITRTKILNIELGGLQPNQYRKIEDEELKMFLETLGL